MRKIKTLIPDIILSLYLFVAVFLPDFSHIATKYIVFGIDISIVMISIIRTGKIRIHNNILRIIYGFIPFWIYYLIVQTVHCFTSDVYSNKLFLNGIKSLSNVFLYYIVLMLAFYIIFDKTNMSGERVARIVFITSAIQTACVMAAYFNSSIKYRFINMTMKYSQNDIIKRAIQTYSKDRCYGFAGNLFDAFGYVMSILAVVVIVYGLEKKKKPYLIFPFFMLFASLLNARTGFVLILIGALIAFLYYFDITKILKFAGGLVVTVVLVMAVYNYIPQYTKNAVKASINQTILLVNEGETTGVYGEILGNDIVWPDNIPFGDGASPELLAYYSGIDSGYIQCLWRFGLLGSILLFGGFLNMFLQAYRLTNKKAVRSILACVIMIFFVYLLKLFSITNYGAATLIFGIPTAIISLNRKNNEDEDEEFEIQLERYRQSITFGQHNHCNIQKI